MYMIAQTLRKKDRKQHNTTQHNTTQRLRQLFQKKKLLGFEPTPHVRVDVMVGPVKPVIPGLHCFELAS